MSRNNNMVQLFGYETDNGRNSVLWQDPMYFSQPRGQAGRELDENLGNWKLSKRPFNTDDVFTGQWVTIGDCGQPCLVRLDPDGTLAESLLFKPDDSWPGTWRMEMGILYIKIGQYELSVVASKDGNMHSGLEYEGDSSQPSAYFKVIRLV